MELHPETAAREGTGDGDWVHLETEKGRIRQRASLNGRADPM